MIRNLKGQLAAAMVDGDDSASGGSTWDSVKPVKMDDIQTGRNVYIEFVFNNQGTPLYTKASAGKIISCIKEGFRPIYRNEGYNRRGNRFIEWMPISFNAFVEFDDGVFALDAGNSGMFYSDPDGDLSKPFTCLAPDVPSDPSDLTPGSTT